MPLNGKGRDLEQPVAVAQGACALGTCWVQGVCCGEIEMQIQVGDPVRLGLWPLTCISLP